MRLEKASTKAIKYAIMNYHYSKSVPMVQCAYSVFNDNDEWCGVICYAIGATNNIAKPYNLSQGQVIELVRVALNGKQSNTSKSVALSLKMLKKTNPLVKLVISYADTEQGHIGILYQSCNWFFVGSNSGETKYIVNGKQLHRRTVNSLGISSSIESVRANISKDAVLHKTGDKHKYIYPLDKSLIPMCKRLSKPYPKKQSAVIV